MSLEKFMINSSETTIPVYFIKWSLQFQVILEEVEHGFSYHNYSRFVTEALIRSISASSYHVAVSSNQAISKPDSKILTLHGKLSGTGIEDKLPTIALVAHYDSIGIAPV